MKDMLEPKISPGYVLLS